MGKPHTQNFDYKNRHITSSDLWNRLFHNGVPSTVPVELGVPRKLKQVQDVSYDIYGNGKRRWLQKPVQEITSDIWDWMGGKH